MAKCGFREKCMVNKCLDCNMCCKLPEIPNFKKGYAWCKNCNIGFGCKTYNDRPQKCKDFYCLYSFGLTDLKPNKCGFFIFPERKEATEHKIMTIYAEEHKLNDIPKRIMKDHKLKLLVDDQWAFHIRYNSDDNNLAIFDYWSFGMSLKKIKRGEYVHR
jgi:hypothetical protein